MNSHTPLDWIMIAVIPTLLLVEEEFRFSECDTEWLSVSHYFNSTQHPEIHQGTFNLYPLQPTVLKEYPPL